MKRQELEQQLATGQDLLASTNEKHRQQLEAAQQEFRELQAHVEQTAQICREASRRLGEIERLTQELEQAHAEAAAQRRDCDVLRNQATELRERLRESKDQHAADVSLVNQLTVERDRLERRMLNIQDMSRTGQGVEVVKEHA